MEEILSVKHLEKHYAGFDLDASFALRRGRITGFIGRNGAGKTTALKSMLSLVHPDGGSIEFFGLDFKEHERDIKKKIGFVSGGFSYYPHKKLKAITAATRAFYPDWREDAYNGYIEKFGLDEAKTPAQLSDGMKVKYALALALSHGAQLLILDEPTSGIDPVSREELVDIFLSLSDEGKTVFFSTHITSDLEKCADDVVYIRRGKILATGALDGFISEYAAAEFSPAAFEAVPPELRAALIGVKRSKIGYSALVSAENAERARAAGGVVRHADLETIMVHLDREGREGEDE